MREEQLKQLLADTGTKEDDYYISTKLYNQRYNYGVDRYKTTDVEDIFQDKHGNWHGEVTNRYVGGLTDREGVMWDKEKKHWTYNG